MPDLICRPLSEEDWNRWDEFALAHPHGTVFHTTDWLRGLPGRLEVHVLQEEGTEIVAGGAAFVRNRRFGVRGIHPPTLTPYTAPLIAVSAEDKEDAQRAQYQLGLQILLQRAALAGHVDFLLHPLEGNALPYLWHGYSTEIGYTNFIDGNPDDYLQRLSYGHRKRMRRLLRMCEAGDVQVDEVRDPTTVFPLLRATMDTKKFAYDLESIQRLFAAEGHDVRWRGTLVSASGEPHACALYAFDARSVYSLVGGVSRSGNSDLANSHLLCFDAMIRFALENGRRFDFCGSSLPGVDHFNRRYGGRLVPRIRVQKSTSLRMFALRTAKALLTERRKHDKLVD